MAAVVGGANRGLGAGNDGAIYHVVVMTAPHRFLLKGRNSLAGAISLRRGGCEEHEQF